MKLGTVTFQRAVVVLPWGTGTSAQRQSGVTYGRKRISVLLYIFLDRCGWNLVQEVFTHAVKHCDLRKNRTFYPPFPLIFVKIGTVKAYCSYGVQCNYTDPCDIQKVKNASLMTSLSHGVQHWPVRSPCRQRSCVSHNRRCVSASLHAHCCESVLQHFHTAG